MPDKPTVPLFPPQGIQAELDLMYLCNDSTLKALQEQITAEEERAQEAEKVLDTKITEEQDRAEEAERALDSKINTEIGRATTAERALADQIAQEKNRAEDAEAALKSDIAAEQTRAENAESALNTAIEGEADRAKNAEAGLSSKIEQETQRATTAENSLQDAITAETARATAAEEKNAQAIEEINEVIPNQASASNQLADKAFVNSTVQTSTANFRGNWATYADIPSDVNEYPEDYAGSKTPTVNDYLVVADDETHNHEAWRYKYTGNWATEGKNGWEAEYMLNETPFTAAQLAALNSGITAEYVSQIDTNRHDISDCKGDISALENDKQDKLTAGNNITIEGNTISAADGVPAMSDDTVGKYLTNEGGVAKWSAKNPVINTATNTSSIALGPEKNPAIAQDSNTVAVGGNAQATSPKAVAVGVNSHAYVSSIAIGADADASRSNTIQIGEGKNMTIGSLQVWDHALLDKSTGLIPSARFAADGTDGQVLMKQGDNAVWGDAVTDDVLEIITLED